MTAGRARRGAVLLVAAGAGLALLPSCGAETVEAAGTTPAETDTYTSPSQDLGHGSVATYVTRDADGEPTEVGLRMTRAALDGLPPTGVTLMIDMPDQAADTAFDHVMFNWNPQGHDPVELFGVPHFDIHFDMVDMATIESITPADPEYAAKAENFPDAKYVPQDYAPFPGAPVAAQAVPNMGVHLVDSTDTSLVPGQYEFTEILINGVWDGEYTFIEPMITRDWLLSGPSLEEPLKLPEAYQQTAWYPTTYAVHVDDETEDYLVSLGGLTARTAS